VYRDADDGYNSRYGNRDAYRNEFRRGFSSGYREGYYNVRGNGGNRRALRATIGSIKAATTAFTIAGQDARAGTRIQRSARGYSDGWEKGRDDGHDRDRYDPVRHGDYKDGDNGYERSYGSKDAYKNNYRSGFRQGYEAGYRDTRGIARR
jgi:flagellar biosynthesis/type III secretory pathway protein FliH